MPKEVLNVEEAAEFLGFAPYTIREKVRTGQIPGRKIGGEWRFSSRALLEWLESGNGSLTDRGTKSLLREESPYL